MDTERVGTHFTNCWKDGGYRHYACAVAEAERQREAIRNAPHGACNYWNHVDVDEQEREKWCDCWKSRALGEEAAHDHR